MLPVFSTVGEPPVLRRLRSVPAGWSSSAAREPALGPIGELRTDDRNDLPSSAGSKKSATSGRVTGSGRSGSPCAPSPAGAAPRRRGERVCWPDSLAGFVAYPAPFLPKSTVFAAYCAHRVLPVCAWPSRGAESSRPRHFGRRSRAATCAGINSRTWPTARTAWYRAVTPCAMHAASYVDLLFPDSSVRPLLRR